MKIKVFLGLLLVVFLSTAGSCKGDSNEVEDIRENIVGKWHATLDDGSVPEDFEVEITKDEGDKSKIYLSNFVNNGKSAYATLTGSNLTVPEQTVGNYTVSADGTISDNYQGITWSILIDGENFTSSFVPGGITKNTEM